MFCIYIKEAAAKQKLNRSRSLKFSLQQEQEQELESIFQEQDWIRSQKFWTPITSAMGHHRFSFSNEDSKVKTSNTI